MKKSKTYKVIIGCMSVLLFNSLSAQDVHQSRSDIENNKRIENYQKLKNLGYQDEEIFEDLGNANFLNENYTASLFWYDKLRKADEKSSLSASYEERYRYALEKSGKTTAIQANEDKDWLAMIKSDYEIDGEPLQANLTESLANNYRGLGSRENDIRQLEEQLLSGNRSEATGEHAYKAPIALTEDGRTAYFSKPAYVKPLYGIFSKKEKVHKIFKAEKVNGEWKNVKEVAVCPKHNSAMHPAISSDGKRLFFASDMPGTYGEYDIYVSNIRNDGTVGVAKNLGEKVNTKKNDLYPSVVAGNTLFFASEGRKGYGGLDIYMAQVGRNKVGFATNLGSPINSMEDDFSISLTTENEMGYVMSNRGNHKSDVQQVAFSYSSKKNPEEKKDYKILEALNSDVKIHYTSSIFEDE